MFKVLVKGLKDGTYNIDLEQDVSTVPDMFPEYFGLIRLNGKLTILGKRISFNGKAECDAKLICDISLNEYIEIITVDVFSSYIADNVLFNENQDQDRDEKIISEDEKEVDLTDIIREEFAVSLPLKRVSPEFRDKEFEEIYPEFSAGKTEIADDDRWAVLKKINLPINEKLID